MLIEGIAGVLSGLIGSIVTSITNYKTQKLKNEHDIAMAKIEKEAMIAEAEMGIKVTEAKVQGELAKADAEIFKESIAKGNEKIIAGGTIEKLLEGKYTKWAGTLLIFILGNVEALRGAMRPLLTIYLVGISSWITYSAIQLLNAQSGALTAAMATAIFGDVTGIILYLTASAIAWWFGNRGIEKYMQNMKK